ncbi:MAG: YXWGXW repeat-containing protein [Alphaproteobacteria bacterium]|nr:YXWGXW repeat-containing protein [Alphaproteobacteria bacterium]
MNHLTRRSLFGGVALGLGAAVIASQVQAQEIFVERAPPPPRVEVVPVIPAERAEREHWQPGYWRWNGHEHVWVEGHYVIRPRPAAVWVPGRWEQRPRGWVFIEGHWA